MRTGLVWMAAGAALSSGAFLILSWMSHQPDPEPELKPYFIVFDRYKVPESEKDRLGEADALPAKRSARIAYECGAKLLTFRPSEGPDDANKIIVPADLQNRRVTDCLQFHFREGEIELRYVWMTTRDLLFS